MKAIVDAFNASGGEGKPLFLQVALSYAPTDAEAVQAAHDQWRHSVLPPHVLAELATPADFDRACAHASPSDVSAVVRTSSNIEQHIDWLHRDLELGFERVYLHNVARAFQDHFIDACGSRVLPEFNRADVSS